MLTIFFRVVLIYLFVFVFLRLMGKRQIGEMQPFELVITIIVADLATAPMSQTSIPLLHGIIPVATLVILHYIISWLSRKSIVLRKVLNGKPVIVISPDGIEYQALKSLNMNFDDLSEGLRTCNFYRIEDVQYAIVETNGTFNVIPKAERSPVVNADMGIKNEEASLPVNLISAGKVMEENMKTLSISLEFIKEQLDKLNVNSIKEVMLFSMDSNGKAFMQPFKGKYQVLETAFKGGDA